MTKNNHDFRAALEACYILSNEPLLYCHRKTIQFALRLADRLQSGEVSEEMYNAAENIEFSEYCGAEDIETQFKAMTAQMMREVEDE